MSAEVSPSTGRRYGVQRVCDAGAYPRSTYYARQRPGGASEGAEGAEVGVAGEEPGRAPAEAVEGAEGGERSSRTLDGLEDDRTLEAQAAPTGARPEPARGRRRGPKPEISDEVLLEAIERDLAESPFTGEGHRKVWRRIRKGPRPIRVARKRVLRVMREAQLLSPHRRPQRPPALHDGRIVTSEPGLMWGTDGIRFETSEEGWGWVFVAVEHWNAECVGFHVTKRGTRFAAYEAVLQGVRKYFGGSAKGAAKGLALRSDHGSQYTSEYFGDQLKFLGINHSYGFVREPETNGVSERFNRTLKEQVFHGKTYRTIAEARAAVARFVKQYNELWLIEKNGLMSPLELRRRHQEESSQTGLAA